MKHPCACGKRCVRQGIRHECTGPKRWKVHDVCECYKLDNGRKTVIATKAKEQP